MLFTLLLVYDYIILTLLVDFKIIYLNIVLFELILELFLMTDDFFLKNPTYIYEIKVELII